MPNNETIQPIRGEYITLGQLVKVLGLISMGGEIREFLSQTDLLVNGEPEDRRGRKLRHDDVLTLPDGSRVRIEAEIRTPSPASD